MQRRVGRRQKVGNDWLGGQTLWGVFSKNQKPNRMQKKSVRKNTCERKWGKGQKRSGEPSEYDASLSTREGRKEDWVEAFQISVLF